MRTVDLPKPFNVTFLSDPSSPHQTVFHPIQRSAKVVLILGYKKMSGIQKTFGDTKNFFGERNRGFFGTQQSFGDTKRKC